MATSTQVNAIYRYTVGLFKAAPGAYMEGLENYFDVDGATTADFAAALANAPLFSSLYSPLVTDEAFANSFLNNLLGDSVSAATMTAAEDYFATELAAGNSRAAVAVAAIDFVATVDAANADWGSARTFFDAEIAAVEGYQLFPGADGLSNDIATLQSIVDPSAGMDIFMTNGIDNLTGSTSDDLFTAYIFDNSNSFESGDRLDGGAGTDTVNAEVGNSQNFAITAKTTSIENFFFQAQSSAWDSADNAVTNGVDEIDGEVQIDAGEFDGVRQLWSDDSRANLVIEDISEDSNLTTIGMRDTDPGDVNYEAYFDLQNITDAGTQATGGSLILTIADLDRMDAGESALSADFPYDILNVTFEGTTYGLDIDYTDVQDHDDLVVAINAAFAADGVTTFEAVQQGSADRIHPVTGNALVVDQVVIQKVDPNMEGNFDAAVSTWDSSGSISGDTNYSTRVQDEQSTAQPSLTQTNIILDNVGRGCAAGDLVVGAMSDENCEGIEQFNVQVDRNSWIDVLRSTNDTLEVVNVVNISDNDAEGDGSLRINTLNDVRVFDASEMDGAVTLTANLSDGIVAKYLDRTDDDRDQSDDNSDPVSYLDVDDTFFSYDFGSANDTLNLTISQANLEAAGTATFEDFELEINGGSGNDSLTLSIDDADANTGDFWYSNQVENASLVINGDAGNDTISTPRAGNVTINAGIGDDTVYADNTGAKAKWVVNATNIDVTDLQGAGNGATGILDGAKLTVTFAAANATTEAGMTQPDADMNDLGFESTVTVTVDNTGDQTTMNQAIKDAINNDAVLSKVLVAADGPADTLVITSKIDGTFATEDLRFDVKAITLADLSTTAQAELQDAYEVLMGNSDAELTQADLDAYADAYDGNMAVISTVNGTSSFFESDNRINVATGDDVVVLGTGANSNDTLVFTGLNNDSVTVVNFDDAAGSASQDALSFASYLTGVTSASESVNSQLPIADSFDIVSVANANFNAAADTVYVINDFAGDAAAGETWANLTAADLLKAIQDDADADNSYGNIEEDDIDVANAPADLVGTTMNHIFMVENDLNDGEYKVFSVKSDTDDDVDDFTSVDFITELDLGATLNFTDDGAAPAPALEDVTVADLQTYDASDDDYNFILDFADVGVKTANINGFDEGDIVTITNAPAGSTYMYDSSSATSIDFAYGDIVAFSNAWAVQMGVLEETLVTDVVAGADLAAQDATLNAAWGDWLVA